MPDLTPDILRLEAHLRETILSAFPTAVPMNLAENPTPALPDKRAMACYALSILDVVMGTQGGTLHPSAHASRAERQIRFVEGLLLGIGVLTVEEIIDLDDQWW